MRRIIRAFWVFVALVFLLETWLWDRLEPIVAAIVGHIPWGGLKAAFAARVERLPPAATLVVFVIPVLLLLPLKLAGLWLLANGHWVAAIGLIVLAKLIGLGVAAFVFDATRGKLLQLAWFRSLYWRVMGWRDWAHDEVKPIRRRVRAVIWLVRPRRTRRLLRRLARARRPAAAAAATAAATSAGAFSEPTAGEPPAAPSARSP
jgi:hypothetical protein